MPKTTPTVVTKQLLPPTAKRKARRGLRPLGPFSYLVMRALQSLPPTDCYGLKIEQHISENLAEIVELSAIYVTLKRLQAKKYITAKPVPSPAGNKHQVMLYRLTAQGEHAIAFSTEFYRRVDQVYAT